MQNSLFSTLKGTRVKKRDRGKAYKDFQISNVKIQIVVGLAQEDKLK